MVVSLPIVTDREHLETLIGLSWHPSSPRILLRCSDHFVLRGCSISTPFVSTVVFAPRVSLQQRNLEVLPSERKRKFSS